MKCFFFIGGMYPGGAERQLVNLCNRLCSYGWDVRIVILRDGVGDGLGLDSRISLYVIKSKNPLVIIKCLYRYLRCERPNLLVNFLFHATILGRIASLIARVPCVSSYRNITYGSAMRDALIRLSAWMDSFTLSNVSAARGSLYPIRSRSHMQVIPNMFLGSTVSVSDYENSVVSEFVSSCHWCFMGRLQPQKNLPALLVAFKKVRQSVNISMTLSIAGDGRESGMLESMVAELGLSNCVTLHGHVADPERLLKEADALILPSRWEGMPNVLMEAMAVGKPCVATPVGAVPDMLGNSERGVLAKDDSPEAIAEAMKRLIDLSRSDREIMINRAARYIAEECNVETVVSQWESLLRKASGLVEYVE